MKKETFRERIIHFYKVYLGLPQYLFAEKIGLGQERVRKGLQPGKKPTAEFFEAIFKKFPLLSPDWVFTGRGEMLLKAEGSKGIEKKGAACSCTLHCHSGLYER